MGDCLVPCSQTSSTPCSCHKPQSCDHHHVSCQTVESLLIPCDACRQVQSVLWQTGGTLVELFQSEGLPSSLQPLLAAVEDIVELGHMTAADVAQWGKEQSRDTRRLAKHLHDVRGTVQPLTDRLAAAETKQDQFRSQIERIQKDQKQEMQEHQTTVCRLERLLQEAQRCTEEMEHELQEERHHCQRETLSMEESISRLKEEAAAQHEALHALECENGTLQEKVKMLQKEQEASRHRQEELQHLEKQICETQLLLDKEKAKYNSTCRQQEVSITMDLVDASHSAQTLAQGACLTYQAAVQLQSSPCPSTPCGIMSL
ncbi:coiled-coil domain-containing protein 157-like [Thalassophryne amazonica]|uniref:coiled-coil domain-containing protein 157-like n=1 Tax=Thalassophryne amazonica TaxID=390379 RepID=UPI0014717186|nr:coiled-coil domain-containing protein 157-like [Thalassophryne amazonica]